MTTSMSPAHGGPRASANGNSHSAVRRALLYKERRELRPALLVGFLIFVGLPLLWTGLFAVIDPKHDVLFGAATYLGLLTGWLFAAVASAQTVCRDFGRDRTQFLTGLPVTPAQIMSAKARASSELILLVALSIAAIDISLSLLSPRPASTSLTSFLILLAPAACMLLAHWLAFVAAAFSRQTLSGVMFACLALVLVLALPLLSSIPTMLLRPLADLWPYSWWGHWGGNGFSWYYYESHQTLVGWFTRVAVPDRWFWEYANAMSPVYRLIDVFLALVGLSIVTLVGHFVARRRRQLPSRFSWKRVLAMVGVFCLLFYTFATLDIIPVLLVIVIPPLVRLSYALSVAAARSERSIQFGTKSIAWTVALVVIGLFAIAMNELGGNQRVTDSVWQPLSDTAFRRVAVGANHFAVSNMFRGVELFQVDDRGKIEACPDTMTCAGWDCCVAFDRQDRCFGVSTMGAGFFGGEEWHALADAEATEQKRVERLMRSRMQMLVQLLQGHAGERTEPAALPLPSIVPAEEQEGALDAQWMAKGSGS